VILAIPLGVLQGSRANQKLDYGITGGLVTLYSLPTFLKGAILILVFSVVLGILPDTAQNYGRSFGTDVTVLILPILTLTLGSIAYFSPKFPPVTLRISLPFGRAPGLIRRDVRYLVGMYRWQPRCRECATELALCAQ
jgi:hypothetical protein